MEPHLVFTDRASAEAAFASRRLRVPDLVLVAAPPNVIVTTLTKAHELAKNLPLFEVPSHGVGSLKLYLCSVTAPIANLQWNPSTLVALLPTTTCSNLACLRELVAKTLALGHHIKVDLDAYKDDALVPLPSSEGLTLTEWLRGAWSCRRRQSLSRRHAEQIEDLEDELQAIHEDDARLPRLKSLTYNDLSAMTSTIMEHEGLSIADISDWFGRGRSGSKLYQSLRRFMLAEPMRQPTLDYHHALVATWLFESGWGVQFRFSARLGRQVPHLYIKMG